MENLEKVKRKHKSRSPEGEARRAAAALEAFKKPESRKRRSESAIRRYQNPEERQKASERTIAQFQDPIKKQAWLKAINNPELKKRQVENSTIHGMSHAPEYKIWVAMKQRCKNKNSTGYEIYGGRGIKVCNEWQGRRGFSNFFKHIGKRPTSKHTLERIDNNGDYEPGNVKWATRIEQMNNFRRNNLVTIKGKTLSVTAWAREIGISPPTLTQRIKYGWSEDDLLKPGGCHPFYSMVTINGKTAPSTTWAKEASISTNLLTRRIRSGHTSAHCLLKPSAPGNRSNNECNCFSR